MEELWRKLSELMVRQPLLWLPVLVADLLAFLVSTGSQAWMRHIVMSRVHSVLGGPTAAVPLDPVALRNVARSVTPLLTPIEWGTNLLRLLLYSLAFLATVALVRAYRARNERPAAEIGTTLRAQFTGMLPVMGTALLVYLVIGALARVASRTLLQHGQRALLGSGAFLGNWFNLFWSVLTVALLGLLVAPAAIQALARRSLERGLRVQSQALSLLLGLVAVLLSGFVNVNLSGMRSASVPARTLLGITGSWIAALPYAVLFAGLGLLAIRAGWGAPASLPGNSDE